MSSRNSRVEFDECIVRIFDDNDNFRGTGLLLNSDGWVLTCGHLFSELNIEDGLALDVPLTKDSPWKIQTIDGKFHDCEILVEKFDNKCLFDYAIVQTSCDMSVSSNLLARRGIDENIKAQMRGFSGNVPILMRVNGTIVGPAFRYDTHCEEPFLQLLWDNNGSYTGFSGAPIFVKDSRIGTFLAGVHSSEIENNLEGQFGTPLINILNKSNLLSDVVSQLSDQDYRRTGFRVDAVTDLNLYLDKKRVIVPEDVIENIKVKESKLVGQISVKKLTNRINQRTVAGDNIVSLVVCDRRPSRVSVRKNLATHFRKQHWRQNMFEVMTDEELRQLRNYREYIKVFLF